ncbi:MAG TPA: tetratricopeptide repeat protein [Roseiflexaceae bacterium]|nr:tetratricopeptide repeat protein [Roseiflexaceae bacterium]
MEHDASFGRWLTRRRQSLRLQRGELAARIGCAVVTLRKIEADERRPSRQIAERLAEQLSIPLHERERFIRVARGELPVDLLSFPTSATPTNIPRPATTLVGRVREVAEIRALLYRADVRLLTLTGSPGVGKTRLALHVASELSNAFANGVFFVALAPLSDPGLVLAAVAQALSVGAAGGQPLADRLGRYLRTRQVLLVLDNFEHVLAAAPQLMQLLAAAPYVRLLVTSRVVLELSGEHRFSIPPLSVPPSADNVKLPIPVAEAQERYAAVDLFVQRARAVTPDFALTDANVLAVSEICRHIDGLPLAIELAAARVALFTPPELLARLDNRFALLTSTARDLPVRHTTLWHALDWSYDLLSPANQRLLRRLGVFVGGCTLEAAQDVCNSDRAVGKDVLDGIGTLVAGNLLQRHEGYDGRSRFGMLETIREYALAQLDASGETEAMRRQHAAYYLALAEAAERAWDLPAEPAWLLRLVSVRNNLQAALRWALEARDTAVALRLNAALFSFWIYCSDLTEARSWLEATLALPYLDGALELVAAEAKVLNVAGYAAALTGDPVQSYAYFERGLALYRKSGDSRGIAWSIRGCGFVHMLRGEYPAAEQLDSESLRLCQSSGDAWGVAWSLYGLAFLKLAQGEWAQAQSLIEDALVRLRQQGIIFAIFRALLALGHVMLEQGDIARADTLYREGLTLRQETLFLQFVADGLEGRGKVVATQGDPVRAARFWGAAEALREAIGNQRWHIFQHSYDRALATARMQLSEEAWAISWAAGRALTPEQAVAEATGDTS